jgi:hypothetical protein
MVASRDVRDEDPKEEEVREKERGVAGEKADAEDAARERRRAEVENFIVASD